MKEPNAKDYEPGYFDSSHVKLALTLKYNKALLTYIDHLKGRFDVVENTSLIREVNGYTCNAKIKLLAEKLTNK